MAEDILFTLQKCETCDAGTSSVGGIAYSEPNAAAGAYRLGFQEPCPRLSEPGQFPFPLPSYSTQYCPQASQDCPPGFSTYGQQIRIYDPEGNIAAEVGAICCPDAFYNCG